MANCTKVMVVEDDEYIANALYDGLSHAGFIVHLCKNGSEALARVEQELPDIMILDLLMPITNGFEVMEKLREQKTSFPILVFSNLGEIEYINKALALGANEFLLKANFTVKEVVAKIKEYCKI